jgi:hypothetical protein
LTKVRILLKSENLNWNECFSDKRSGFDQNFDVNWYLPQKGLYFIEYIFCIDVSIPGRGRYSVLTNDFSLHYDYHFWSWTSRRGESLDLRAARHRFLTSFPNVAATCLVPAHHMSGSERRTPTMNLPEKHEAN